jgi:hypothetical protein
LNWLIGGNSKGILCQWHKIFRFWYHRGRCDVRNWSLVTSVTKELEIASPWFLQQQHFEDFLLSTSQPASQPASQPDRQTDRQKLGCQRYKKEASQNPNQPTSHPVRTPARQKSSRLGGLACLAGLADPALPRHGLACTGLVRLGVAWPKFSWSYLSWPGLTCVGVAWPGLVCPGLAWTGLSMRG